ncbi:MAG: hypothetical protein ABIS35_09150 [Terracoccus sp.]
MELPEEILRLADLQSDVVSRAQLGAAGVPPGMVRWHSTRHWRSLLPGILMLNTGSPTDQQRLVAAQLYAGADAWLRGESALACYGAGPRLRSPVQLYVPHPHRARRVMWLSIAATRLTNERVVERGPLRISCRPRAVVDAAADAIDDRQARALLVGCVQERFVRLADVQHWVGVRRRNGTVRLNAALAEAASGAWSLPESDLARLLLRSPRLAGLMANPGLTTHDRIRLTTPDLWIDEVALAIMVHSRRFHSDVLDWDSTVLADQDLRDADIEVVPLTPHVITTDPAACRAAVHAGLDRALRRPRPPVIATPRDGLAWAS